MCKDMYRKKVQGAIVGLALGDAMGAVVEKLSYEEIREQYGKVTGLDYAWYKESISNKTRGYGTVTDDTLMTLCLINIYKEKEDHLDAYDMAEHMVKEIAFKKMWIPEFEREDYLIERLFYPEKYIFTRHALASCEPREGGIGNMVNCGAAMYMAPVGIVNACDPEKAYHEAIRFAMGHQCSYGLEAAGVLAAAVAQAFIKGTTVDEIARVCMKLAKDGTKQAIHDVMDKVYSMDKESCPAHAFHKVLAKYSSMGDNVHRDSNKAGKGTNDYTPGRLKSIEELPIALGYLVLNKGDFMQAMIEGINSGRDTDSIGCMIGTILGALHGIDVIPKNFINQLCSKNKIDFIAKSDDLYDISKAILHKDLMKQDAIKNKILEIL